MATSRQEVGIETPCGIATRRHCSTVGVYVQALPVLICSVAMVKPHGRLYPMNGRGTARGHRLYFRSTYHEGQKARHEAETAMALKASQDKATPPLHFQGSPGCSNGVLRHWAHTGVQTTAASRDGLHSSTRWTQPMADKQNRQAE